MRQRATCNQHHSCSSCHRTVRILGSSLLAGIRHGSGTALFGRGKSPYLARGTTACFMGPESGPPPPLQPLHPLRQLLAGCWPLSAAAPRPCINQPNACLTRTFVYQGHAGTLPCCAVQQLAAPLLCCMLTKGHTPPQSPTPPPPHRPRCALWHASEANALARHMC